MPYFSILMDLLFKFWFQMDEATSRIHKTMCRRWKSFAKNIDLDLESDFCYLPNSWQYSYPQVLTSSVVPKKGKHATTSTSTLFNSLISSYDFFLFPLWKKTLSGCGYNSWSASGIAIYQYVRNILFCFHRVDF